MGGGLAVGHGVERESESLDGALAAVPGTMACQDALILLRRLGRAPEDFLTGDVVEAGERALPPSGADRRLRWDLGGLHAELDLRRRERGATWARLAEELGCTAEPADAPEARAAR